MEELKFYWSNLLEVLKPTDIVALGPFHYFRELKSDDNSGIFSSFYIYSNEESNHDMTLFKFRNIWNMVAISFIALVVLKALIKLTLGGRSNAKKFGSWEYKTSLLQDYLYVAIGAASFVLLLEAIVHSIFIFDETNSLFASASTGFAGPETIFLVYQLSLLRFAELLVLGLDCAFDMYPRTWKSYVQSLGVMLVPLAVYRSWMYCAWGFVIIPVVFETSRLCFRCVYNAYFKWLSDLGNSKKRVTGTLILLNIALLAGVFGVTTYFQRQKPLHLWTPGEIYAYQVTCVYCVSSVIWWFFKLSGEKSGLQFVQRLTGYSLLASIFKNLYCVFTSEQRYLQKPRKYYVSSRGKVLQTPPTSVTSSPLTKISASKHKEIIAPSIPNSPKVVSAFVERSAKQQLDTKEQLNSNNVTLTPTTQSDARAHAFPQFSAKSKYRVANMRQRQYTAFTTAPNVSRSSNSGSKGDSSILSENDIAVLRQRPRSTGFSLFGFNPLDPGKSVASTRIGALAEMTLETAFSVVESAASPSGRLSSLINSQTVQKMKNFAVKKVDDATWFGVQTVAQTVAAIQPADQSVVDLIKKNSPTKQPQSTSEKYIAERWSPVLEKDTFAPAA